jgi:hypothetical protein
LVELTDTLKCGIEQLIQSSCERAVKSNNDGDDGGLMSARRLCGNRTVTLIGPSRAISVDHAVKQNSATLKVLTVSSLIHVCERGIFPVNGSLTLVVAAIHTTSTYRFWSTKSQTMALHTNSTHTISNIMLISRLMMLHSWTNTLKTSLFQH